MKTVKVFFEDGNSLVSSINGTDSEIIQYYLGQTFNIGTGGEDKLSKAVKILFL